MDAPLSELVDRQAIRDVAEAYARGCDRRQPDAVAKLFTPGGRLAIFAGDPADTEPRSDLRGRETIAKALTRLSRYEATTHFLGQQTVELADDRATAETYCLAHHVGRRDGARRMTVMSIRYLDVLVRTGDGWCLEERRLAVDWTEDRPFGE